MALSPSDAAHLLRRSGFGATADAIAELTALPTREEAILRVTDISRNPSTADIPVGTTKVSNEAVAWDSMAVWWLERMRTSPVPVVEKLALFWHNHFVTSFRPIEDMALLTNQHRTLRAHGTGDFHALCQAVAKDPAMIIYLDNWLNMVGKPQENFGREIMELFTLGPGNYTQRDVVSMTKAWTGHSLDVATGYRTYKFTSAWHDTSPSTLFGKTKSWDGPAALTEVLKGTKAVASSKFIAAKLFSYFAYPVQPSSSVVTPLATAFRSSGLDILTLVREIFRSPAFWSPEARHALVRSPIEWLVASMQALDFTTLGCNAHRWLDRAGQVPFLHVDVQGWKDDARWINTAGAWTRSSFAAYARLVVRNTGLLSELPNLTATDAVDLAAARFGITELSATTRAALEAMHSRAKAENHPWSIALNMVLLLLLSPEFQTA